MDKKHIYVNLVDAYKQCILNPTNPFTIDNADILVFNGRTLMSLYFPTKKEMANPDLLLRRLFISRLSMSKVVRTILILASESIHAFDNMPNVHRAFDAVHIYEGDRDLLRYLQDDVRQRTLIRPAIRQQRMRRFWGTIDFIEQHGIVQNVYESQEIQRGLKVKSWSNPNKERFSKSIAYSYPYLVTSKRETTQSFKDGYEDLMTITTMFNYSMSDGILKNNIEAYDTFMYLNAESIEDIMNNDMNLRTMVFLGYLPGRINHDYDIAGLRDNYYSFMKEKRYL